MGQRETGFTKFDNYFLDHVLPRVSSVEWKIISVIIRGTVGWQKRGGGHRDEVELTNERLQSLTGIGSQALCAGIRRARARGVVIRRPQQKGRQRTFCFSAVPRANLKSLDLPPSTLQDPLPFESDCENRYPKAAEGIVKMEISTAVSDDENHNDNGLVLKRVKKQPDLNTHTQKGHEIVDGVCVCDDEFCFDNITAHVDYDISRGDYVSSRSGLISKLDKERTPTQRRLIRQSLTAIRVREHQRREQDERRKAQEAADLREIEERRARLEARAG